MDAAVGWGRASAFEAKGPIGTLAAIGLPGWGRAGVHIRRGWG